MTRATEAVDAAGIPHRVITYGRANSIGEAAELRGVPVSSIVKTLAVRRGEDDYVLVLVSGDRAIDWKKLRRELGVTRLSLADQDDLVRVTGYARGMVTPFGALGPWPLYVDTVVAGLPEASLGGGAHGVAINLAGRDLVDHFDAHVADVSRPE